MSPTFLLQLKMSMMLQVPLVMLHPFRSSSHEDPKEGRPASWTNHQQCRQFLEQKKVLDQKHTWYVVPNTMPRSDSNSICKKPGLFNICVAMNLHHCHTDIE
jgi:hypothetical protein